MTRAFSHFIVLPSRDGVPGRRPRCCSCRQPATHRHALYGWYYCEACARRLEEQYTRAFPEGRGL